MAARNIRSHRELVVYSQAVANAMDIFARTKQFPPEERYSLTDQVRRSSRSVAANIAEAWRKRRYEAAFVAKLSDAETEAAETQTWIEFAVKCGYLSRSDGAALYRSYDAIMRTLVSMINHSEDWLIQSPRVPVSSRHRVNQSSEVANKS